MNILEQIIADKRKEVERKKELVPARLLEMLPFFGKKTISLKTSIKMESGIIAEFKRRSPSRGVINDRSSVQEVVSAYSQFGASGVSVLTDEKYFGGSNDDLLTARPVCSKPILRKDFIIDEYQLLEAKAIGADVILLIAANLSVEEVKNLAAFAKALGLEVLLELHAEEELAHVCDDVDLVGINNRNLKNFEVDLEHSIRLAQKLPVDKPRIAESGINNSDTILYLKQQGFDGFLMGEYFMKQPDPSIAFAQFVQLLSS